MKKMLSAAIAVGALVAISVSARAETKVVRMLGPSDIVGSATAVDRELGTNVDFAGLGVNGDDFLCFRMDLLRADKNKVIGFGVDCLRWDEPGLIFGGAPALTDGMTVTDNTMTVTVLSFFALKKGTLVNFGTTTIQPFVSGFGDGYVGGDESGFKVTHLTGALPSSMPSLVAGTGKYQNVTGNTRLSGAVSTDAINPGAGKGPAFDCLWQINIDDHDDDDHDDDKDDDDKDDHDD